MKSKKEKAKIVSFYSHLFIKIAVVLLLPLLSALTVYFVMNNQHPSDQPLSVTVSRGQKAQVQLPDGTLVWLNSDGMLSYDNTYNKKERIVYLEGEAYFEVSKDKMRPFIVKTNNISVEALGTKFDVKSYPKDKFISAILIEGSIGVNSPTQSEILNPSEKITINKSDGRFVKSTLLDAEKNLLWINNQLAFEHERLEDITKVLERMYNINIRFMSDELKDIRFSGTVKNNNLENILQLIEFVSPVCCSIEKDSMIIIREKR